MKLLAIDTSTDACSAALLCDGRILSRYRLAPRRHAELILPMTEALLAEAGVGKRQLDGLAFGRGPGAFTGLRVATGVTQGIALGLDLPVAAVSTLAALAQRAAREYGRTRVLAGLDARLGEVYWAAYACDNGAEMVLQGTEQVCAPAAVTVPAGSGWSGAGSAWQAFAQTLGARSGAHCTEQEAALLPHAEDIVMLGERMFARGEVVAAPAALPVYLRDQVASPPGAGRSGGQ